MMSDLQIKQALERAAKTVSLRPERGQRVYRNVAIVGEGTQCLVEEAGRELIVDVGKALGGNDAGPTPSAVLRSALGGCVAIGVKLWAARHDVPVERVEVVLETDVDARGQLGVDAAVTPGFGAIRLEITVTSGAAAEVVEEVVEASLRASPLWDVFVNPQTIEPRVTLVGGAVTLEDA